MGERYLESAHDQVLCPRATCKRGTLSREDPRAFCGLRGRLAGSGKLRHALDRECVLFSNTKKKEGAQVAWSPSTPAVLATCSFDRCVQLHALNGAPLGGQSASTGAVPVAPRRAPAWLGCRVLRDWNPSPYELGNVCFQSRHESLCDDLRASLSTRRRAAFSHTPLVFTRYSERRLVSTL